MLKITLEGNELSSLQENALFFAAKENSFELPDIEHLYSKLQTIAELRNDVKNLEKISDAEIKVHHYNGKNTITIEKIIFQWQS
jgi:hypothetical protein